MRAEAESAARRLWHLLPGGVRSLYWKFRQVGWSVRYGAQPEVQWIRKVMNADARETFSYLRPQELDVVEISGSLWSGLPWKSHTVLEYPAFDLCNPSPPMSRFDLVICEHVLEHVVDPITATRTLRSLCKDEGQVFVATPFLVRLHNHPSDYWRFTPEGLSRLLESQRLKPIWVRSWGNRRVVRANFDKWVMAFPWSSLRNEPDLPVVVWALARPI